MKGSSIEVGPKREKGEQGLRGEIGNTGSPGPKNIHIRHMLYQHVADIVKKGNFYTLKCPDLDYANINYSQQRKVVKGNYASETYDDDPYTSNTPQSGNWNFSAAFEFDAIEAASTNQLIFVRFHDADRYVDSEKYMISRGYPKGGFDLSIFL